MEDRPGFVARFGKLGTDEQGRGDHPVPPLRVPLGGDPVLRRGAHGNPPRRDLRITAPVHPHCGILPASEVSDLRASLGRHPGDQVDLSEPNQRAFHGIDRDAEQDHARAVDTGHPDVLVAHPAPPSAATCELPALATPRAASTSSESIPNCNGPSPTKGSSAHRSRSSNFLPHQLMRPSRSSLSTILFGAYGRPVTDPLRGQLRRSHRPATTLTGQLRRSVTTGVTERRTWPVWPSRRSAIRQGEEASQLVRRHAGRFSSAGDCPGGSLPRRARGLRPGGPAVCGKPGPRCPGRWRRGLRSAVACDR